MGRQKLPPGFGREKTLRVRLTDAEREVVDKAARLKGYATTSAWAREQLVRLARKIEASQ